MTKKLVILFISAWWIVIKKLKKVFIFRKRNCSGEIKRSKMATRGKGTVITTHKATYIPTHLNPGYRGFLPDLRHQYGETYGRSTTRHFYTERARAVALVPKHASVREEYKPIIKRKSEPGIPPCLSQQKNQQTTLGHALGNDFDTSMPSSLGNNKIFAGNSHILAKSLNRSRIYELDNMMQKCQDHRKAYKDISGCTPYVKYFVVPENFGDRYVGNRYAKYCDMHGINIDDNGSGRQNGGLLVKNGRYSCLGRYYRSSNRERAMRDLHFEKR